MYMDNQRRLRILAISGSLRRASSNSALVEAAARLTPDDLEISIYRELAELPPFNPDLDGSDGSAPAAVAAFRASLDTSAAILISSPEYAHGVPGVLKNALDWVVGSGELIDKPIALVNASARATTRLGAAGGNVDDHVGARDPGGIRDDPARWPVVEPR